MRTNLKVFRTRQKMSQTEFAEACGISRGLYSLIEMGKRNGKQSFWNAMQKAFNIPDTDMWQLMQCDE